MYQQKFTQIDKLSKSIEEVKEHYNVVVIGSGYGGGISASRMARAGQAVCVLERGKEFLPGDFPNSLIPAGKDMQIHTAKGQSGNKLGLFDFHVHPGMSVLVGCGLGGTSLINANVSIKPEPRVFEDLRWPKIIREEFNDPNSLLNKGYELSEKMLKPNPLPKNIQLNKLDSLQKSAEANGENFYRLNINVNFDVNGTNHVGVQQTPCNLCGDCCSGCNYTSKNTTQMNYLPDANNHGAEIFTEVKVEFLEQKSDKWIIHFSPMGAGIDKFTNSTPFITADNVIVAAGTLGSTEILLRSRDKGLKLSDKLGQQFSGNGDVLGFGYNTDVPVFGVGYAKKGPKTSNQAGPCITGVIDLRNQPVLNDGMVIEDAAVPGAIAKLLPSALALNATLMGKNEEQKRSLGVWFKHKIRTLTSFILGPYSGAIKNTQTYLVMSHDDSNGKFELQNNNLSLDYKRVGYEPIFTRINDQLAKETKALNGIYVKNPTWNKLLGEELITVHPLGGCFMGENVHSGVVNHKGQVFSNSGDSEVYKGLYVADGAVIPRSLGTNPLFTISAVAERINAHIAIDNGWKINYDFNTEFKKKEITARTVGVEFTETMKGFFSATVNDGNYQKGFDEGQSKNNAFEFTLTIRTDDAYTMIKNPEHSAHMVGSVTAPFLSSKPLAATQGIFNLFVDDPDTVDSKLMKYAMKLTSEEGKTYYFKGFKFVHDYSILKMWHDTSTLYITIFDGDSDNAKILGQGILHIKAADFQKQMTTMKAVNANSTTESLKALAAFGKYFSKSLFEVYGGIFVPNKYYSPDAMPRAKRALRLPAPEVYPIKTADNIELLLTRYNGGKKGPIMMVHGFSGNSQTFSIGTIDTNLAEYFFEHGYDVWLFDYRLSNLLPSSKNQYTVDEVAKFDYPAAIDEIKKVTGAAEIDILAHCVGSIALFMAMLNGLKGVKSIVSAQIAANFYAAPQVKWKAGLHVPEVLDALGIKSLTAYTSTEETWFEKLYDNALKLYAEPIAGDCDNPTCHRMTFMFGPLFEHDQMNKATHDIEVEMFQNANMRTYEHLTLMIRKHILVNAEGEDIYMDNLNRLNIPIAFIHGEKNQLFDPKSTKTTYDELCAVNGKDNYEYHLIKGYGHNDCMYGKNTAKDVYPILLNHFEKSNQSKATN